jgi:hypothetical protein
MVFQKQLSIKGSDEKGLVIAPLLHNQEACLHQSTNQAQ